MFIHVFLVMKKIFRLSSNYMKFLLCGRQTQMAMSADVEKGMEKVAVGRKRAHNGRQISKLSLQPEIVSQ